jgi:hypothetical protein
VNLRALLSSAFGTEGETDVTKHHRWIIVAAALLVLPSLASAASIECSRIGTSYDHLFADGNKRVEAILAEFKALPKTATEQQKDRIRKKFCAVGGEVLGLYKLVQAMAKDCIAHGEKLDQLIDVINKQLNLAQQGVNAPCS